MIELPSKLQFLFQPYRYKVAYGGRGSAKSWSFARALLIKAAASPTRVLCAREVQNSIKDSVHKLLSDQIAALGLSAFYEILETEIRGENGSLFIFSGLGTQTVESIKSFEGVDICWVEEAKNVTKKSWSILTPTIRKPGSEIWVTFNPDLETDETYQRFVVNPPSGCVSREINWRDNPWWNDILEAERQDTKRTDPDTYDNIWEGKPKRVVDGAIYAKEITAAYDEGRVRNVPYDPLLKVHTVWDLGWNDAMTIGMFQKSASEVRCIDYIEDSHKTLAEYVAMLEKRPYRYGRDFIPHDGRTKNLQTGKSAEEILRAMGRKVFVGGQDSIEEGVKAARMVFPRVYFDLGKTARLLECLKRYRRHINRATLEPSAPLHDEFSHGADMFRYMAMNVDKMLNDNETKIDFPYVASQGGRTGY